MNFKNLLSELLVEANKRDVLITKLGLNEMNAETISKICGPFSVFIANKIIDIVQKQIIKDKNRDFTRQETVEYLNGGYTIRTSQTQLTTIMDWVRTGLNGNVKPYQNFTYDQLVQESKKWHDELGVGNGEINYVEEMKSYWIIVTRELGFIGLTLTLIPVMRNVIEWVTVDVQILTIQSTHLEKLNDLTRSILSIKVILPQP